MDQESPNDLIGYDQMIRRAMHGIIREALMFADREGLPGEHHFYITFKTSDPRVSMSERLHAKYPGEMTIILQHQFTELTVRQNDFSVVLSFNGIREKISVPFTAITSFLDPGVQFGLRLDGAESAEDTVTPEPSTQKEPEHNTGQDSAGQDSTGQDSTGQDRVIPLDIYRKK